MVLFAIAIDSDGNIHVDGDTTSEDFPTIPGAFDTSCGFDGNCSDANDDVFISKLDPDLSGAELEEVIIDGCHTGVADQVLDDGSTISDRISECAAGARNHGKFVSCVSKLTNNLKKTGIITGKEKGAIQRCAAQADIP